MAEASWLKGTVEQNWETEQGNQTQRRKSQRTDRTPKSGFPDLALHPEVCCTNLIEGSQA